MSAAESAPPPPALTHNARQFILFRVFFNCRFYYPVYAVLFFASILMLAEMLLLLATPVGGGVMVFWLLLANRIVNGAAEAAASGADEALAYDSGIRPSAKPWLGSRGHSLALRSRSTPSAA
jgi:hypothetical protein